MKSILEGISADASQYKQMVPATKDAHYDFLVKCLQESHRHIESLVKSEKMCATDLNSAQDFANRLREKVLAQEK